MDALSKNKIKWIRSLRLKKNRDSEGLFVVEGAKMVQEILKDESATVECLVTTDESLDFAGTQFHTDTATMKAISGLSTPSSLLAVVKKPQISTKKSPWTLVLDGVQDPGNMGTIIRTADWFGITDIVCSQQTVDCFNPKVVQSTMGSIFRVCVRYERLEDYFENVDRPVFGALLEGENMHCVTVPKEGILLMGNEGNGISEELIDFISHPIHIPGKGGAESLNVAVATGILLGRFSH
ncbi:MAG: RNA methyltransferase [bacterium]|nr:RNA methyltransferase [bacterium]